MYFVHFFFLVNFHYSCNKFFIFFYKNNVSIFIFKLIFIAQNMVRTLQYTSYTHDRIKKYIKNAWVSEPNKTLKGWYSQ